MYGTLSSYACVDIYVSQTNVHTLPGTPEAASHFFETAHHSAESNCDAGTSADERAGYSVRGRELRETSEWRGPGRREGGLDAIAKEAAWENNNYFIGNQRTVLPL